MPSTFRTFGPFELPPQEDGGRSLKATWRENRDLRYGIGVYLVVEKKGKSFLPWYVGKSDRSFGSRLQNHDVFQSLPDHLRKKSIYIFLIARVTTKRRNLIRSKRKYVEGGDQEVLSVHKRFRSIAHLEYELIGTCRSLNVGLLNSQLKKFQEGLHVPGYIDSPGEELDASALKLREMLAPTR